MSAQRLVTVATRELSVQTRRAASHVYADLASRGMAFPAKVRRIKCIGRVLNNVCIL